MILSRDAVVIAIAHRWRSIPEIPIMTAKVAMVFRKRKKAWH